MKKQCRITVYNPRSISVLFVTGLLRTVKGEEEGQEASKHENVKGKMDKCNPRLWMGDEF